MSSEPLNQTGQSLAQSQVKELLLVHSDFLLNIFLKKLPEPDALDVFQSLCLRVLTNSLPDTIKDIRGYLYQIARNAITDHLRKTSTYQKKIQAYSQQTKPKYSDNPAEKIMQFEFLMKAFEKIGQFLCPSINQVFIQKYQHNLDHYQIAENMNISKETVDRYLTIGTKQIQELYPLLFGDSDEQT